MKKIMVDMSATLIHHGHIRLLKKASEIGEVIVGLTTDEEIFNYKGYMPELAFEYRKEILESIKYVSSVVAVPWLLDEYILNKYNIDFLAHGADNSNLIPKEKLKIFSRTKGVSSSDIRKNILHSITQINNKKLMLTPGPAAVLAQNLQNIKPIFGRGDDEYDNMSNAVTKWVKEISGADEVITLQGSATLALEIAAHSFISGKVLLVSTGYYSDRLKKLLPNNCQLTICTYENLTKIKKTFDWVLCAYTETSVAFKVNLPLVKKQAEQLSAKLFVDATGSIGLEEHHNLADVMAFSSCKGLFGLTGAAFIGYKSKLPSKKLDYFYFNLETHKNKMVTGAYHAIASLYGVIKQHNMLKQRVINSKNLVLKKWSNITRSINQPLLCTYLDGEVVANDNNIILYTPRSKLTGSVVCHLGEVYKDSLNITNRISIKC